MDDTVDGFGVLIIEVGCIRFEAPFKALINEFVVIG